MRISLIVAVADNGVIGDRGRLPWHLSADLKRFKALTMGHHLLLGRKTFAAIGRPLPGRRMIVVSRGRPELPSEVALASSLDTALEIAHAAGETEAFVAGGAEIYRQALPLADRLYMTRVHAAPAGDVFFPAWDEAEWSLAEREEGVPDERSPLPHTFLTYERRPATAPPSA